MEQELPRLAQLLATQMADEGTNVLVTASLQNGRQVAIEVTEEAWPLIIDASIACGAAVATRRGQPASSQPGDGTLRIVDLPTVEIQAESAPDASVKLYLRAGLVDFSVRLPAAGATALARLLTHFAR